MYYSLEHKRETSWFVQYQPLQKTNEKHEPENGFVIARYPNSQGVTNR